MRVKKPSLIITFATTSEAMGVESFCNQHGLPGRLVPVPEEITSGCGMAWKVTPQEKEIMEQELKAAGLQWEGMYMAELWEWE